MWWRADAAKESRFVDWCEGLGRRREPGEDRCRRARDVSAATLATLVEIHLISSPVIHEQG